MITRAARAAVMVLAVAGAAAGGGCKKKASQAQCNELIDRFAALVVKERVKDASAELVQAEQARERKEAAGDESFRNCTSEVSTEEHACAMKAITSDTFLKCLE